MKCEMDFCLYNENRECLLDIIRVNVFGMCEDCMLIPVPQEDLQALKRKRRQAQAEKQAH